MNGLGRSGSRGPRGRLDSTRPGLHAWHVGNEPTLKDLGLDVRAARKGRGWTQATLAKTANVATTLVGRMERGQVVSDTTLKAVARALALPDSVIAPHLTDLRPAPAPERVEPAAATWGDLRRELQWWHGRLRESPEDYERLLYLLDLSAQVEGQARSTQSGVQLDAHG